MSRLAAGHAASLVGLGVRREVYPADEFADLVDIAVAEGNDDRGTEYAIYAQDITAPHAPGWVPETVLVVTVLQGWAGAYYRERDDSGRRDAWITFNPQPSPAAPELIYDSQSPSNFPANAVISVDQLRKAIGEYLETGQRPTSVQWQEPDRWLTW